MAPCILPFEGFKNFKKKDTPRHERFNHKPKNDSRAD
jgi:hypothetical protein